MSPFVLRSRLLVVALLLVPASAADVGPLDVQVQATGVAVLLQDGPKLVPDLSDAPLPPTGLRATVEGPDVVLTWDAPPAGSPAAYRIYRLGLPVVDAFPRVPPMHAAWPPLQQVPGGNTSYRDTTVDLLSHHYVYVVTATYGSIADAPQASSGQESPPSNPAYTWNTFTSCPWLENNFPDHPPVEVNEECFGPRPGQGSIRVESGNAGSD